MRRASRFIIVCLAAMLFSAPAARSAGPENVLLIINDNSADSKAIGEYYAGKRKIPTKNIVRIKCHAGEHIDTPGYLNDIEKPVKAHLAKVDAAKTIDYLVLTKGVPIRVTGLDRSVDGMLMGMHMGLKIEGLERGIDNPYFEKTEHFSRRKYGFYLATRLDGYTAKDAKALVDRSLAAKPERGLFLIDSTPNRNSGGYRLVNLHMSQAHDAIVRKGYISYLDQTTTFIGARKKLMGYFSWGSNDSDFDVTRYRTNEFLPGAIAETAVSTSARTLNQTEGGQSLISDLIAGTGVTGVKGYVSEPFLHAIADPRVLFPRYLSGYNLADSFYMASRWILWKDLVIGDPLCAPYKK